MVDYFKENRISDTHSQPLEYKDGKQKRRERRAKKRKAKELMNYVINNS